MKRTLWFCAVIAAAAVASVAPELGPAPAHAQVAAALGRPLPAQDLPTGTVTVRVVAGDFARAASGHEVTLVVAGTPQKAVADGEGRATFSGVAQGSLAIAKIAGTAGEVASQEFTIPPSGGIRLILSTAPIGEGSGAAAAAGGAPQAAGEHPSAQGAPAQGMPEPRQMSGRSRPEMGDPPGVLTVRVTYNDFSDAQPPAKQPVALVGYAADDKVTVQRGVTDAAGRVQFKGLDVSGGIAYYAMTLLPRGAVIDRLMSTGVTMIGESGMRVSLSGEKRTSGAEAIDDFAVFDNQVPGTQPGTVAVGVIANTADAGGELRLVNAESGAVLGTQPLAATRDGRVDVRGQFGTPAPAANVPAGMLEVIAGGGSRDRSVLPGVLMAVVAEAGTPGAPAAPTAQTDGEGLARFSLTPGRYRVIASISGTDIRSEPFEFATTGMRLPLGVLWRDGAMPRVASFPGVEGAGTLVVYAEARIGGQNYRSLPFQPLADRGSSATIMVLPRLAFSFELSGVVEDRYLGVQGPLVLYNNSWSPYRAGPDGLLIDLPKEFVGGTVAEKDAGVATAEPAGGIRFRRPLAPGGVRAHIGFSLRVDGGRVAWDWDLPHGTTNSLLAILESPGLDLQLPAGTQVDTEASRGGGNFRVVRGLEIPPGQRMSIGLRGLPVQAAWKVWLPRLAGAVVIALLGFAVWIAAFGRRPDTADAEKERISARVSALLDELAASKNDARRAELMAELEMLWPASSQGAGSAVGRGQG